jgi:hypothetical protein
MKKIIGIDGHIILYCKNHYKHSKSLIEDLKKIWAVRCGYDYNVNDNSMVINIANNLYRILKPTIENNERFQENLHDHIFSNLYKDLNTAERIILFYCSELCNLQVKQKINNKWTKLIKLPKPKKQIFNRILRGNGRYNDHKLINN